MINETAQGIIKGRGQNSLLCNIWIHKSLKIGVCYPAHIDGGKN